MRPSGVTPINIADVARKAGVSKATVSRALNEPHLVKPATREHILAVVREMGYRANPFAQGLNTGKAYTVGLVVANLSNPVFAEIAEGCDQVLRQAGYQMVITNTYQESALEEDAFEAMLRRRVSGLIVGGLQDVRNVTKAVEAGMPVTVVGQTPVADVPYDAVLMDDENGTLLIVHHVAERGYGEMAVITGNPEHPISRRRLEALRTGMAAAGLTFRPELVMQGDFRSVESGWAAMRLLLARGGHPRVVISQNDLMAIGAIRALHEAGLVVPGEVAVIGCDDIPLASFSWPSLTTLRTDNLEIGRRAAGCILQRVTDQEAPPLRVAIPASLVVRESG